MMHRQLLIISALIIPLLNCAESDDGRLEGSQVNDPAGGTSAGSAGAAGSGGASGRVCEPGTSQDCSCPAGGQGVRRCADTGLGYLTCDCGAGGSGASAAGGQGGTPVCSPGQQVGCPCVGGDDGAQVCDDDGGGYGPCMCPDPGAGGQGGSGFGQGGAAFGQGGSGQGGSAFGQGGSAFGQGGSAQGGGGQGGSGQGGSGAGNSTVADGSAETCPGQSLDLGTLPLTVTGDTRNYQPDQSGGCYSTSGRDLVFHLAPTFSGTLNITVTPSSSYDSVVYYQTGSCTSSGSVTCFYGGVNTGEVDSGSIDVVAGVDYYLKLDGWTASSGGTFTLLIERAP